MAHSSNYASKEYLDRSYVWGLYRLLPSFGYFSIEINHDGNTETLEFSKNTEEETGRKQLFDLLGRFPDSYRNIESEFAFGFGFDLNVKVTV